MWWWILAIATLLGGITAILSLCDKIALRFKKKPSPLINLLAELRYNYEHLQQIKYSTPPALRTEVWDKVWSEAEEIPDPLKSQLNTIYRNIKGAKEIHRSIQSATGETTPEQIEIERHLEEAKHGISHNLQKLLNIPPAAASNAKLHSPKGAGNNQYTLYDRWITRLKNNLYFAIILVIAFLIVIWNVYSPVINYFFPKLPPLYLQQAYPTEHYKDPIDLRTNSARLEFSRGHQPFWLSVLNDNKEKSYEADFLIIKLRNRFDVEVRRESLGWKVFEPNEQYNFSFSKSLNPEILSVIHPLFVRFPKKGIYKLTFLISLKHNSAVKGEFSIEVY